MNGNKDQGSGVRDQRLEIGDQRSRIRGQGLSGCLVLKGHDFSRAASEPESTPALAPEGCSSPMSNAKSLHSEGALPRGLKPRVFMRFHTARLKSCPFKTSFSRRSVLAGFSFLLLLASAVSSAQQQKPWEKVPIPPLHEFKPQQPKRIALKNGIVLFLQEDHELPFVSGSVLIPGGSRDEDPAKCGLIDLYGQTWRTSGIAKMSGDAMDDLLESKAAHIETGGGEDSTILSWDSLKADTDQVYDLAMDLLFHPKFDPQKLRLAQQQTSTAIVRRNDEVGQIAGREATALSLSHDKKPQSKPSAKRPR